LTRINQRNSSSKTGDCAIIGSAVVWFYISIRTQCIAKIHSSEDLSKAQQVKPAEAELIIIQNTMPEPMGKTIYFRQ
jgi:hypothetical protein